MLSSSLVTGVLDVNYNKKFPVFSKGIRLFKNEHKLVSFGKGQKSQNMSCF